MYDKQTAIAFLRRAIAEKTEQKVDYIVTNNDGQFSRTMELREVFFDEGRAMRALARAVKAVAYDTE